MNRFLSRAFAGILMLAASNISATVDAQTSLKTTSLNPTQVQPTAIKPTAIQAKPQAVSAMPSLFTANYQPLDEDEQSLWMQMTEIEGKMKNSDFLIDDPKLNGYIRSVLCRVVGQGRCAATRIYLIRTPHFNAAMAPNGMMMVWSGLLLRAKNEAELASVLAHEFSHFERRHSLQSFRDLRAKSDALTWLSMVPAIGMIGQLDLVGSVFAFSRDMERQADLMALNYLVESGYDPMAASAIWEHLRAEMDAVAKAKKQQSMKDQGGGFFSTHPATGERMKYLRDAAVAANVSKPFGGTAEYRREIRPWWPMLIDDQIKLNDFGTTEFLLSQLAGANWTDELLYARAELYRARGKKKDFESAILYYRQSIAQNSQIAENWRGLGLALMRSGQLEIGKVQLKLYLSKKTDAADRDLIAAMVG
jgi:beta-barrel assembly-enhancing protease